MSALAVRIRRFLRYPSLTQLAGDERVLQRARTLVMLFYAVLPFVAYVYFKAWTLPLSRENFDSLWPLMWSEWLALSDDATMSIVRATFLVTSVLALWFYRHWWARALAFVGLWQAHAFISSFGAISHEFYPWLYVSFIFVFLPSLLESGASSFEDRRRLLLVIWWAQAFIMLLYSMAGMWKFYVAFAQFFAGEIHGLSMYAFAYQVADWVPRLQKEAVLAPYIVAYPWAAWPFYVGSHVFQLFAFWTVIRPSLQRIWGVELILFHIGTFLVMGIEFDMLVLFVTVLFVFSPFVPERTDWKRIFFDLPIVGQIAEWALRKRVTASRP